MGDNNQSSYKVKSIHKTFENVRSRQLTFLGHLKGSCSLNVALVRYVLALFCVCTTRVHCLVIWQHNFIVVLGSRQACQALLEELFLIAL